MRASVNGELAEALYRATEHKGYNVRLDCASPMHFEGQHANPIADQVLECIPWKTTRAHHFPETKHVNLQEIEEVIWEVQDRVMRHGVQPMRSVNWADSLVTLGCWAKGRSSSFAVNGSLRRSSCWCIFGRKALANIFCESARNPADDP